MLDPIKVQIDIKPWPIQMRVVEKPHIEQPINRRFPEPGKVVKVQEILPVAYQQPKAVR